MCSHVKITQVKIVKKNFEINSYKMLTWYGSTIVLFLAERRTPSDDELADIAEVVLTPAGVESMGGLRPLAGRAEDPKNEMKDN